MYDILRGWERIMLDNRIRVKKQSVEIKYINVSNVNENTGGGFLLEWLFLWNNIF